MTTTTKPIAFLDAKGTTRKMSDEDASRLMRESLSVRPAPSSKAFEAAKAERDASIALAAKMQAAPSLSEACAIRRAEEPALIATTHQAPPASPQRPAPIARAPRGGK